MTCKDKVAIVTGAAGNGMGRSIALTLAREGAKVVVNYRTNESMACDVVDYINRSGGCALPVRAAGGMTSRLIGWIRPGLWTTCSANWRLYII